MPIEFSSADETPPLRDIMGALDDEGCREIIAVVAEPMTVPEIADAADLPLSSTYRKLDRLTDARLVTETVGVRQGRHHTSRYVANFERLSIGFGDDGEFEVDIDHANGESAGLWSDVTREF